jgi:hypothetical protein
MMKIVYISLALVLLSLPAHAERNESRNSDGRSGSGCLCDSPNTMTIIDQYGNTIRAPLQIGGYSTSSAGKTSFGGHDTQSGAAGGNVSVSPKGGEY